MIRFEGRTSSSRRGRKRSRLANDLDGSRWAASSSRIGRVDGVHQRRRRCRPWSRYRRRRRRGFDRRWAADQTDEQTSKTSLVTLATGEKEGPDRRARRRERLVSGWRQDVMWRAAGAGQPAARTSFVRRRALGSAGLPATANRRAVNAHRLQSIGYGWHYPGGTLAIAPLLPCCSLALPCHLPPA